MNLKENFVYLIKEKAFEVCLCTCIVALVIAISTGIKQELAIKEECAANGGTSIYDTNFNLVCVEVIVIIKQ